MSLTILYVCALFKKNYLGIRKAKRYVPPAPLHSAHGTASQYSQCQTGQCTAGEASRWTAVAGRWERHRAVRA